MMMTHACWEHCHEDELADRGFRASHERLIQSPGIDNEVITERCRIDCNFPHLYLASTLVETNPEAILLSGAG